MIRTLLHGHAAGVALDASAISVLVVGLLVASSTAAQTADAPVPASSAEVPAEVPAESSSANRVTRVAVYDFVGDDVEPRIARVVTHSVLAELRKLAGLGVIGMDEVRVMLDHEAQKQLVGCDDESCLADIAGALGVDVLIIGSLAHVGDETIFGMRRIEQSTASVSASVNQRLEPKNGEEFLAMVGPAVEELFPDNELLPGRERGVAPELALSLNPPPLDPWVFWTVVGVTSSVATGSAALGAAAGALWLDYDGYLNVGQSTPILYGSVKDKGALTNAVAIAAWTGAGLSVVGAGVATGLYFFTDWQGLRGE